MVILHVVAPGEIGGLERVVQMLARGHGALGHEVHVAAVVERSGADRPFLEPLADVGVHTHTLIVGARGYLRERTLIADLCRQTRPDVVHTHGYRPDVVDARVARQLGIPVVTTLHGYTAGGWKNRCYEWLQYRTFRGFDAVVAVSQELATRLERAGVARGRIAAVPNAWCETAPPLDRATARRTLGLSGADFVVGWVGRLSYEKGPDVLVDALAQLADLPLVISVLGEGRERASLEARAVDLGVGERMRWHGVVPDAGRLFAGFDAFVLSSRSEGTPIVLFEAMAAGVPIVATRVGGVPDVLSAAEGVLLPPEDPRALARAIRSVVHNPPAAARRACAARDRLAHFEIAPWLDRYEAIYGRVSHTQPGVPVSAPN